MGLVGVSAAVDLDSAQRVSLDGEYPSLEKLLHELSWRLEFELRSFDANDRSVTASIHDCPLDDALRRILSKESFVVGLEITSGRGEAARIAWVRVLGTNAEAVARRAATRPVPVSVGLVLPPGLFRSAFGSKDAGERAAALQAIERQILGNPAQREAFLRTDSRQLAEVLRRLPDAQAYLTAVAGQQSDIRMREKLLDIGASLTEASIQQ